jgi:hypothetical protein
MDCHTTALMATIATWCRVVYCAFSLSTEKRVWLFLLLWPDLFAKTCFSSTGSDGEVYGKLREKGIYYASLFYESRPTNTTWLRQNTPTHLFCTSSVQVSEVCKWLR